DDDVVLGRDDERAGLGTERLQDAEGLLRARGVDRPALGDADLAVAELREHRVPQRRAACLLRHLERVVARHRTEGGATAAPVRDLLRSHAGAAGVLLLPELLVRPGDLAARLGLR